jgi:hypothetical protein
MNTEKSYIIAKLKSTLKNQIIIQGQQSNGKRQVWVRKACRRGDTKKKLKKFVAWAKANGAVVEWNHHWGIVIKPTADLDTNATSWMWLIGEPVPAPQSTTMVKHRIKPGVVAQVEPVSTKYRFRKAVVRMSKVGNLYVVAPSFQFVGRICGSDKTGSGYPCRRWSRGVCKTHQ